MKKILATLSAALMVVAFFGVTQATADPGPNTSNEKGLCTAYFNGQKRGHDKDGDGDTDNARAFQGLERLAEDDGTSEEPGVPGEQALASDVLEFCNSLAIIIGGQPEHNGRFDCYEAGSDTPRDTDDSDGDGVAGDGELECLPNTNGDDGTGGDHPSGKDKS